MLQLVRGAQGYPRVQKASGPASRVVAFTKMDQDQQLVFGEVYAPGFPDSQGDFMTRESIQKMAYRFMKAMRLDKIDVLHSQAESGSYVVESFIARDDDPTFIPGSWVLGVHIPDQTQWSLVKSGELNGFSLDGMGVRVSTELTYDLPDAVRGMTDVSDSHSHTFFVKYDEDGCFLGGRTEPASDGHYHVIKRGTATELSSGHSHRFSFIEGFLEAQVA